MKKSYKLVDLDCANCAAKMEAAINKIDGVNKATVSFMTQKLVIDAADEKFDTVLNEAVNAIKKVDSACEVIIK